MTAKSSRLLRRLIKGSVICCAVIAMSSAAFAEETDGGIKDNGVEEINKAYDYTVDTSEDGVGASAGISSGGWASLGSELSYMKLPQESVSPDGEEGVWCYCIDISTDTEDGHKYSVTTLDAAKYYTDEAADKIRAILINSYPYIGIEELGQKYELTELMEEEAFMATQWILWYYSNPEGLVDAGGGKYYPANIYKPSEYPRETITIWYDDEEGNEVRSQSKNVVALAKALDTLAPAPAYETEPANITFSKTVYKDKVIFDFGESTGLETLENINLTVKDKQGNDVPFTAKGTSLTVQYDDLLPAEGAAELTLTLEGLQLLSKDVYFFSPEGGRDASQSRVAVYGGTTPVASSASFTLTGEEFEEAEEDPDTPTDPEGPAEPTDPEDPAGDQNKNDPKDPTGSAAGNPQTGDGFAVLPLILAALAALAAAVFVSTGIISLRRKKA